MSKHNYFLVVYGGSDSIQEHLTPILPNVSITHNLEIVPAQISNMFFVSDKDGEMTEERLAHLYREFMLSQSLENKTKIPIYIKKVNSMLPIF